MNSIFYLCSPQSMEFADCISDVSGFHKTQDTADGFSCLNHIFNIILLIREKQGGKKGTVDTQHFPEIPDHNLHGTEG